MATSHIIDFVQSLTAEEIKIAKEFIYKSNEVALSGNKIKTLFEVLIENPQRKYTDLELSKMLKCSPAALRVLKSRLFDKIKDAMLSDKHLENPYVFSEIERIFFSLKKKMVFVKALTRSQNRGRTEAINTILNEIINTAKKYELFEILRDASIELKNFNGVRYGIDEFEKIDKEIIFYEKCFKGVKKANDAYYRLILNEQFTSNLTQSQLENYIRNSIEEMKIDFKNTNAIEINYYMLILKFALYEKERDYKNAIITCNKLLQLIKRSDILYSKRRISFVFSNLSLFNVYTRNFSKAILYSRKAGQFLIPNSFDSLVCKEQEFYAQFHSGNYQNSFQISEELIHHPHTDIGEYRQSKFFYQQAYVHLMMKNYKAAQNLVTKSLKFEKDKTGWNIALRVLITMIFIELKKFAEASTSIATLRKHIQRNGKVKEIKKRDVLILKLLRELEKDGFKRNERNKISINLIKELSDRNKPTAWNYYTPELMPFQEWVMTLPSKN